MREPAIQNIPPPKTDLGQRIVKVFKEELGMPMLNIDYAAIEIRLYEQLLRSTPDPKSNPLKRG